MNCTSLEFEIISVYNGDEPFLIHMKSYLKQVLMEETCRIEKKKNPKMNYMLLDSKIILVCNSIISFYKLSYEGQGKKKLGTRT